MTSFKCFCLLFLIVFLMMLPSPSRGQAAGNLTAASTDCGVGNSCIITQIPQNVGGATLKLSGTFMSTNQFEASASPSNTAPADRVWVALLATPSNSSTAASSATSGGAWQANVAGYTFIRIRTSAYTSGTAVAAINLSSASARGGSGGGGGGGSGTLACSTSGGIIFETAANVGGCDTQLIWDNTLKRQKIGTDLSALTTGGAGFPLLSPADVDLSIQKQSTVNTDSSTSVPLYPFAYAPSAGAALLAQSTWGVSYATGTHSAVGGQFSAITVPAMGQTIGGYSNGLEGNINMIGAGTLTEANGVWSSIGINGAGVITNARGFLDNPDSTGSSGSVTNYMGYYARFTTGFATNMYGHYAESFGNSTTGFPFYSAGGRSRFNVAAGQTITAVDINSASTVTPTAVFAVRGNGLGTKYFGSPALIEVVQEDSTPYSMVSSSKTATAGSFVSQYIYDNADYEFSDYNGTNTCNLDLRPAILIVDTSTGNCAFKYFALRSATNCSSAASPAVCGSAPAGSVVIAAAGTSVVVNTSAVTANSQVVVQEDQSLGTKLSVTCNTGFLTAPPVISARSSGVSFTLTIAAGLAVNPVCFSYTIVN